MNRTQSYVVSLVTLVVVLGIVLVLPIFNGSYDSVTDRLLWTLHNRLLTVAIPLGLAGEAALFYAALKFHNSGDPNPTEENRRLEIALTIGVAIVLLFVGVSSYLVLVDPMVSATPNASPQPSDVTVNITGQNWYWTITYPEENVTARNLLVLPRNRSVFFTITSGDVIHSIHIPALGIKQDAIPGQRNFFRTRLTSNGTYRLYCAEFCGAGHSKMLATVKVVNEDTFRSWLQRQRTGE